MKNAKGVVIAFQNKAFDNTLQTANAFRSVVIAFQNKAFDNYKAKDYGKVTL